MPAEHRNDNAALADPDGAGPRLYFQKVPEPKTAKPGGTSTCVPPEGRADALEAGCTRLVALGVNAVCIVMQDTEGNEFRFD